jgi:predicted N-acyltransferase
MWRFNPYDTLLQKTGAISPEINSVRYEIYSQFTNVIDLRNDLENVLKRWSKGHRGAFNKAVKGGVSVELASTFEEWMDYYQIFQENSKRWEKSKAGFAEDYDRRMFEIIFDRKSPNIRLWLARHEGKSIAGAICLYAKNHVLGWHLTDCLNI